ncbi:ROK family protein [Streptomyces sp. AM 2-1-1]|uniref:ROK family protein n=1 Tax=Streptomyces sp. AM 2-1-1 TaxID=3028709 RepID=UPI0023B97A7D|nr:ROK family protein [Streptomyces sp. AM 2-1-1]WEH42114.1 ROK family protein [Streptomyces sp. AM 2-1-1]
MSSQPILAPAPGGGLTGALDIGGTKIAGALVDPGGSLRCRVRRAAPAQGSSRALLDAVYEVVDVLAADPLWADVRALGIGSAGPVDLTHGTVSPVNIPAWRDFPLAASVAAHPALAHRPVVLAGDAVAMAAAEHRHGAARGHDKALCLVVSTGVGAGLVLDGTVHHGLTGNAGHLGHISVDFDGEPCPCGAIGCLEGIASGTAITRHALSLGWRPTTSAVTSAVATAARAGDPAAVAAFDRAARALAAGIAATAALVEIDVAVVGGGVAHSGEVLFSPLGHHLRRYATMPFMRHLRAVPAELGSDAGLVGAAVLAGAPEPAHVAGPATVTVGPRTSPRRRSGEENQA